MKFQPQPGDKIICDNGEEFICCTLETLVSEGFNPYFRNKSDSAVFGTKGDYSEWMYWYDGGYPNAPEWNIREVIPQGVESSDDKKEEVKEESRYTVEEVFKAAADAWDVKPWPSKVIQEVKDHLSKINDPQYKEYLRLRAIYE